MRRALPLFAMVPGTTFAQAPREVQNALHPAGVQAAHIYDLWVVMLAVCTVVFVLVMIGLAIALRRSGRGDASTPPDLSGLREQEPRLQRNVVIAAALSVVLLLGLLATSVFTDRALARMPLADAINVEITAHQWWWEVRYQNDAPSKIFSTANELEIPVGRPVLATLHADDVIHSFWVPNLHGKKDLIPGQTSTIQFRADAPGTYRGQCAEFCGFQHAWMAFHVIARPNAEFEQWAEAQRRPAPVPSDDVARRGLDVFLTAPCATCHAIQGTPAQANFGPDLTHVASRPSLAAGRLPNTRQHLEAWILDPQQFKPGTNMPATTLSKDNLDALLTYLETLR